MYKEIERHVFLKLDFIKTFDSIKAQEGPLSQKVRGKLIQWDLGIEYHRVEINGLATL